MDFIVIGFLIVFSMVFFLLEFFFLPGIVIGAVAGIFCLVGAVFYAYAFVGNLCGHFTLAFVILSLLAVIYAYYKSKNPDKE